MRMEGDTDGFIVSFKSGGDIYFGEASSKNNLY
jgi:hypothetical protein